MEKIPTREEIEEEIYLPIKTVREKLGYEITMTRLPFLSENERALAVAKDLNLPVLGWGIHNASDWDCPASGTTVLYNSIPASDKQITYRQGATHNEYGSGAKFTRINDQAPALAA